MEILLVRFVLKQVDLGQELILLLFELRNLFLELLRIHRLLSHLVNSLMSGLEFSLQVLVVLVSFLHLLIDKELVWDLEWNQEFCGISSPLEFGHFSDEPKQQVLNGSLLTMHNFALERWVEVSWVSQDFEETTNALLSLILGFSLDINTQVLLVEMAEDAIQKFKIFKWRLVVEFDKRKILHKWRSVQAINDDFDFLGTKRRSFSEKLGLWGGLAEDTLA